MSEDVESKKIDWFGQRNLMIITIVLSTIIAIFTSLPAVVKAIGLILAILCGADAVRTIAHYGLGTGVPSIGMLALGMGITAAFAGMAAPFLFEEGAYLGVIISIVLAAIGGCIYGLVAVKVLKMKIPVMVSGMIQLTIAGTLSIILASSVLAGTWHLDAVLNSVVNTGWIGVIFIMAAMGMLHPYNACLGPDEKRNRTLVLSIELGSLLSLLLGVGLIFNDLIDGAILIAVSGIIWAISYIVFVKLSMKQAYEVVGTGLIKTLE